MFLCFFLALMRDREDMDVESVRQIHYNTVYHVDMHY